MTSFITPVTQAIYAKLTGTLAITDLLASTTSVYSVMAADEAEFNYVVYGLQGGTPETDSAITAESALWFIRAYSNTTPADAGEIIEEIDGVLHLKPLTVAGWNNFWIARELNLEGVENTQAGEKIWMRGGFYRIRLSQ